MNPYPLFCAQLETATKVIDHAAQQDMRWWVLALLVVVGLTLRVLARYWTGRYDKLSDRLDRVQDERTHYLEQNGAKLVETIADNAAAMREFSHAISAVKHLFSERSSTQS